MTKVKIYDTTLRDGTQAEGISFSLEDKVKIAQRLDELGIHYIEGGWPGSNPKDIKFFQRMKRMRLKNAQLTAFGSTRRAKYPAKEDPNIRALLKSETKVVCIFGKSWDLHVRIALGVSLEKNLELIEDSVSYLKKKKKEVSPFVILIAATTVMIGVGMLLLGASRGEVFPMLIGLFIVILGMTFGWDL